MTEREAAGTARAWQVVLQKIERDLLEGTLSPGDRLPGERELATQLGVGRSSVREALRALEVLGLIRTATGSGPSAGAIIIATPHGGLSALLRLQVAAQGFPLRDVVRTRLVLEAAVVGDLAREEEPDLSAARVTLDAMEQADLTAQEFLALDAQFHLALAEASGNVVTAAMMGGLRDAIESYVLQAVAAIPDWAATADQLVHEHHGILQAIDEGDVEAAEQRLRAHITGYYRQSQQPL